MDTTGISLCYSTPYGINSLAYQLKSRDNDLRFLFHLDEPCGIITFLICLFAGLLIACAMINMSTACRNEKIYQNLQNDAVEKLPRKGSVLDIRPAYNCIHKHFDTNFRQSLVYIDWIQLKQTEVFQEKAKRTLWKERLEIEIMNSRISCIKKLLRPEAPQSQWRKSRSPKVFCRNPPNPA